VRIRFALVAVSLLACAARGPRPAPATDAPLELHATLTCTEANLGTPACEALRRAVEGPVTDSDPAVARALDWLDDGVRAAPGRLHQGYRADGSGLVAMAWGESAALADGNEPPEALASATRLASLDDVGPGDALGQGRELVLFAGWADPSKRDAIVVEQPHAGPTALCAVPREALAALEPLRSRRR
jgi:hypothetical protein